jgi:hypothetical protein
MSQALYPSILVLLLLALALLFSGCDVLKSLGLLPNDDEEPTPRVFYGKPVQGAEEMPSIKEKFGVPETGTAGVDAAFKELSVFLRGGGFQADLGNDPSDRVIKIGDWIDLEGGLSVEAYARGAVNPAGDFAYDTAAATAFVDALDEDKGVLCRLIVVGINSFQSGGDYTYQEMENPPPPHVVFQFQNIPVMRRLNPTETNSGGYPGSEIREYLTEVGGVEGSGNFLAGLERAGVPDGVLWAPSRTISGKTKAETIKDKLWLPTMRELSGTAGYSVSGHETALNQAKLTYYDNAPKRVKYRTDSTAGVYWTGSCDSGLDRSFCYITNNGGNNTFSTTSAVGCVPAFCVY